MSDRQNVLAARALLGARQAARQFGHAWIGSEHLILGLLALEEEPLREELVAHGIDEDAVRLELARLAPPGQTSGRDVPLACSLDDVLRQATRLTPARLLQDIRLEHLVLALLRQRAGLGYALLVKMSVDVDDLERAVAERIAVLGDDLPAAVSLPA